MNKIQNKLTKISLLLMLIIPNMVEAQPIRLQEKYQRLPFGSIKPMGWIKDQMKKDMAGFVGNLDKLVPDLINDPIYSTGRLHKNSKIKDLGNLKSGDAAGDEQYKWWNSETQSNWWDGYIRNALLLDDQPAIEKVKQRITNILATQDQDGYLGIYDKELRYKFASENGELWSKTTLYRGLLAYYEYTHDDTVLRALIRAVDNVMENYPINHSQPFYSGNDFSGGVAHGLTFTDILDRLHQITGNPVYLNYACFLYTNFSNNHSSEKDAQLKNILDPAYKFDCHGAHTYEHLRPLIVAVFASGDPDLQKALKIYCDRIKCSLTATGGPIGDEWIGGRIANGTHTGYEYCSIHELTDSYSLLFQKSGDCAAAEAIETIFYNAAQGSRNPDHSSIAYLKTDNSYEMAGTRNGEVEVDKKQTRYKYSPVHQDVAVCCAPNAGRITPYFLQSCWFTERDNSLVASVLAPNVLETKLKGQKVKIEEITDYPYNNLFEFRIFSEKPIQFKLKIRKPTWAVLVKTNEHYQIDNGFIVFDREFEKNARIKIEFLSQVEIKKDMNCERFFKYGALVFATPFAGVEQKGRIYAEGFEDRMYFPKNMTSYEFQERNEANYSEGKIHVLLKNKVTGKVEKVELIPVAKTILRQVTFK